MNIHPDFEELLRLIEEHGIEYMIVGGYAVAYHGYPRFTKDIDLFFRMTSDNALRLRQVLQAIAARALNPDTEIAEIKQGLAEVRAEHIFADIASSRPRSLLSSLNAKAQCYAKAQR